MTTKTMTRGAPRPSAVPVRRLCDLCGAKAMKHDHLCVLCRMDLAQAEAANDLNKESMT